MRKVERRLTKTERVRWREVQNEIIITISNNNNNNKQSKMFTCELSF